MERKHSRKTTLKYFNGDTVTLKSGQKWFITQLHQPVLPQQHYYSGRSVEEGRLCKIYPNEINENLTDIDLGRDRVWKAMAEEEFN